MPRSNYFNDPTANPFVTPEPTQRREHPIEIIIPTRATSPTLKTVLKTHARQTLPHSHCIIDTNPTIEPATTHQHNATQTNSHRTLWLPPRPQDHPCGVITDALDAAMATTRATYALLTHDDVWLKDETILKDMITIAAHNAAAFVGYQMSPRDHVTDEWHDMPSHTLTLVDVQQYRDNRLRWSIHDAIRNTADHRCKPGWPDTETNIGRMIKALDLKVCWIGSETNDQHYEDDLIVHRRSLTSARALRPTDPIRDLDWINQQNQRFG